MDNLTRRWQICRWVRARHYKWTACNSRQQQGDLSRELDVQARRTSDIYHWKAQVWDQYQLFKWPGLWVHAVSRWQVLREVQWEPEQGSSVLDFHRWRYSVSRCFRKEYHGPMGQWRSSWRWSKFPFFFDHFKYNWLSVWRMIFFLSSPSLLRMVLRHSFL